MEVVIACICTILGGVVSILSIASMLGKPLVENAKIMTELSTAVKNLTEQMKSFEVGNNSAHKRIHERIDHAEDEIKEQGRKIAKLEAKE